MICVIYLGRMKKILTLFIFLSIARTTMAQSEPVKFMNYTTAGFSVKFSDTLRYGTISSQFNTIPMAGGDVTTGTWSLAVDGNFYSISTADYPESLVKKKNVSFFVDEAKN